VTVVGAVSPAGGDFSEPITQYSLRLAGTFWALDTSLARARHFPAIDWNRSYTLYDLREWFAREVAPDWEEHRAWARELLGQEAQLLEVVQLLGADALAPPQRVVLRTGRMLREDFLQQSAFDDRDAYCALPLQLALLRVIRRAHLAMAGAVERGATAEEAGTAPGLVETAAMRFWPVEDADARGAALAERIEHELREMG
jgi:V/A-type H+-transporting ATPase subunit A